MTEIFERVCDAQVYCVFPTSTCASHTLSKSQITFFSIKYDILRKIKSVPYPIAAKLENPKFHI